MKNKAWIRCWEFLNVVDILFFYNNKYMVFRFPVNPIYKKGNKRFRISYKLFSYYIHEKIEYISQESLKEFTEIDLENTRFGPHKLVDNGILKIVK